MAAVRETGNTVKTLGGVGKYITHLSNMVTWFAVKALMCKEACVCWTALVASFSVSFQDAANKQVQVANFL